MDAREKSEAVLSCVFPDLAVRFRRVKQDLLECHRVDIFATSGLRSAATQYALYEKGRKKNEDGSWKVTEPHAIVTHVLFGLHNVGLALDASFAGGDPYLEACEKGAYLWSEYGRFAKAHGLEWGGDWRYFTDKPHVQMLYGMSLDEIRKIYDLHGLPGIYAVCRKKISEGGYL